MAGMGAPSRLLEKTSFFAFSLFILLILGAPFFVFVGMKVLNTIPSDCGDVCAHGLGLLYIGVNWLAIFSCAALFGALGVTMSLIRRAAPLERLQGVGAGKVLILAYGSGALFALLLTAMFVGGLVQGALFPDFHGSYSWRELNFRIPDWGKLMVWSFLAGFSERLLPQMLDKLTDRATKEDPPA